MQKSAQKKGGTAWKTIYDSLMGGLRPMIPFVAGGGIIMAISFMMGMGVDESTAGPFAKMLYDIGHNNAMFLMIPVFAGYISYTIAGTNGLAAGMVGGMIAKNTSTGFFGGIIAGFVAGYVVKALEKALVNFPKDLESIKKLMIIPIISIFTVGIVMESVVAGPIGFMNTSLTNWINGLGTENMIIVGIILGAMMAVDLGGPINKVAYAFGLSAIAEGNFVPMAAVMAGGMVPPLGVALSTTLFKKKFTEEQRAQGKTFYLLGASFITESCMPVALSDPIRIIPSCIAGSAVAGAICAFFNVSLPAPHGGIFVIPVIEGGLMPKLIFIGALAAGMLVSAVLIGILRKNVDEETDQVRISQPEAAVNMTAMTENEALVSEQSEVVL